MKQRLLITGGSGFVAFHLINEAIRRGFEVFASVRATSVVDHLKDLPVQLVQLNLEDEASLKIALEERQYDYIIHAAAVTKASTQQSYDKFNAHYTASLAKAAVASGIPLKKFLFISSLAAVGPRDNNANNTEEFLPVTPYGKSKLLAEKMLAKIKGLPWVAVRPTAIYGPREKDILIMLKLLNKGFEPYIGRVAQQLSFIYVKDLARLIMDALTSPVVGKAFNISDGEVYDRFALAGYSKKILDRKTKRFFLPLPFVNAMASVLEMVGSIKGEMPVLNRTKLKELTASWPCDISDAEEELDFQPAYNLETGLKETFNWYKQNGWL